MTDTPDVTQAVGPLSGVVIADFSRVLAGPYCTMLLADMGAEVIKVESTMGDDTRSWIPPMNEAGEGTYYLSINRNKRSIALDLGDDDDNAVAQNLAARADVFIHNFKPGGLSRFGLDYAAVEATNPGIVYCSISGFGSGAGASMPGYDLLVQGISGLMSLTGSPEGPPYRAGVAVFDVIAGLHSAIGILAALQHRDKTGRGQEIEINLLSSALSALVNQTSAYVAGGVVPNRMGNAHLSLYPYEPMPTSDGELIIAAGNDRQFRKLVEALGVAGLADDKRYSTVHSRNVNRAQLRPLLEKKLATRSAQEWFRVLTDAGVPCAPINDVQAGVELAEELGLEPVVCTDGVNTIRNPIRMSETPARYDLAPPKLGEHDGEIRAWIAAGKDVR
jgi:crotonobetainyl-CoA:carnitine CoA-transferase CaiB-like acyl-CoA transferase